METKASHPAPAFTRPFAGTFAIGVSTTDPVHPVADGALHQAAVDRLRHRLRRHEEVLLDARGHIDVQLFGFTSFGPRARMHSMTQALVKTPLTGMGAADHIDVGSSWAAMTRNPTTNRTRLQDIDDQADQSLRHRDLSLRPAKELRRRRRGLRMRTPFLIALSFALSFFLPLWILLETLEHGADVSTIIYFVVIAALAVMAVMQVAEGIAAVRAPREPPDDRPPAPAASAIIAAYLPNESATILATLTAFLAQRNAGGLQVILAYNTPVDLPIESVLHSLAAEHPSLTVMRVPGSTSKASNVNAALAIVEGEFVGVFDADHEPMAGAFDRAWRWLSAGAGIVQGHCVIRNGDESWVSRLVAVEFEQIYAVNHPGRAKLQGFGIFGGSNGYWRTDLLRRVRFDSAYLTEDIDSSLRALRLGAEIVSDPGLLSRELAPVDLVSLWRQRMRWAQGWFQVSLRHGHAAVVDQDVGARQRFGLFLLLGWREAYPWLSALMWPTLVFAVLRDGHLPPFALLLTVVTVLTVVSGPIQIAFAYRLAAPEIRARRSWWRSYVVLSVLFYQEWKNLIVRVAHLRQLIRQRQWVVTPRGHVQHASGGSPAEVPSTGT